MHLRSEVNWDDVGKDLDALKGLPKSEQSEFAKSLPAYDFSKLFRSDLDKCTLRPHSLADGNIFIEKVRG